MNKRAYPFPIVHPIYEHDWSHYPEKVRIPMDDGKVLDYFGEVQHTESVFKPMLDHFTILCIGHLPRRRRRQ